MNRMRLPLFILCSLLAALQARAQFEIKGRTTNLLDQRRAGASVTVTGTAVTSITVRGGGGGYTAAPLVVIAAPANGTTATATAVLTGGVVTSITITNGGSGYTPASPPAVSIAGPKIPVLPSGTPPVTTPQFAGVAVTTGTSGARNNTPANENYHLLSVTGGRYPRALEAGGTATKMVLVRSGFGNPFASGVPRYLMGDEIVRPNMDWNNVPVSPTYWRSRPVAPGETFTNAYLTNLGLIEQPVISTSTVTVTKSETSSSVVTVSAAGGLTTGATLLGQTVHLISGTTVTLSGNANQTITSSTSVPFAPYQPFYYSVHADKVFATQPGRVTVTWVSNAPDTSKSGETVASYKFRTETFSVSSASQTEPRLIFWTEKTFNGPLISIPKGRIVRVNPVFNSFVSGKAVEYEPVGGNPNPNPNVAAAAEPRTLWYDDQNGLPALHSYNSEGRVFVEYLGSEVEGRSGVHNFMGADIVEIRRSADTETVQTYLGEKLLPRSGPPEDGDGLLIPQVPRDVAQSSTLLYGNFIRPDGVTDYFAERENLNPDSIVFYWMETRDAGLHSITQPGVAGLNIAWPKLKRNYLQTWPQALALFQPVNVTPTGAGPAIGPRFEPTSLPQIAFQDDPGNQEASIDGQTQRLIVDLSGSTDKTNRTLLKFNSSSGPWYVRLFIQSWDALGTPAIPDPDGDGPLTGTPPVYTLNDSNADGVADLTLSATVGTRLEPPSLDYATAGHIDTGTCYSPGAYLDPLSDTGFDAAALGGIIPVNALPGKEKLTVWWFKKVVPPNSRFAPFYVPAVAARYTVSYPANAQDLVIASGKGLENPSLTSAQKSGRLYVQNNSAAPGYNPNEEHAILLDGNVYALRDDLNLPASSSSPYVLLQYTDAGGRPAMRVAHVVRSNATYPLTYSKVAGTPLQAPMPLTLLPLPLLGDGSVRNEEVGLNVDNLPGTNAAGATAAYRTHYNNFTFEDRKGQHWLFRGPHQNGTPSFGMKFYYYLQAGFWFPSLATQPDAGSIQPFVAADAGEDLNGGDAITLTYLPKWPDDPSLEKPAVLGVLQTAETLTLQKAGLPQVMGQSSAEIIYQQSIALDGPTKPSVALHDPLRGKRVLLEKTALDRMPPSILTTDFGGRTYLQNLPPNLQNRFYFDGFQGAKGGLNVIGEFFDEIVGEDYLNLNQLSAQDILDLKAACPATDTVNKPKWDAAIEALSTTLETFEESKTVPGTYVKIPSQDRVIGAMQRSDITSPDTAVTSYALSSTGQGTGYVTLVFGNGSAFTDSGDPVDMQVIKVSPALYPGDLKVVLSSNPLDEQVVLRHSGDYGGNPENFEFRWRYGFPDNGNPPLGDPATDPAWYDPDPDGSRHAGSSILVGGSPQAMLSQPAVLMGDVYFTMSYRLKAQGNKPAGDWSAWTRASLVEGWIKRVLAKITPFNQRMTDLYNNSVNTDVSLLTQAGTRWEGNIALNLSNVNDHGLIEIYETILNRGKSFTIGSDIDTTSANNALILAAGYLNDLYTILGNEAYADAANPTISIDDQDSATEVNTSRFAFEGQVSSSLEEERALLMGRDDFATPGTTLAPAYNRLWWNYTRGINSGEAIYAVNYNIKEKPGSSTADGIVDAADAQRMFPQGHGDAYGHYLTALTGYYKLLTHPYFTWTPSAEAVNVLGIPVMVDYKDERKFAASAANLGHTAEQMLALEHRRSYADDPAAGWGQFRDGKVNPRTGVARSMGMDEISSRAGQGAYFNWITANSLLPDKDTDTGHTGVQIVDRTTVPEINELVTLATGFQTTMDSANARLNPLGLSPGAIAFDIDPYFNNSLGQELADPSVVGKGHYEQVAVRALAALNNAAGAFNQAATMTRLLRSQENQIASQQIAIEDENYALLQDLYTIYGMAYAGDIGPGKTYPEGYTDPDYNRWFIIDRPTDLVDTSKPVTVTIKIPTVIKTFTGGAIDAIVTSYTSGDVVEKTFKVSPNQVAQFADVVGPGTALGKRGYTGTLQQALLEAHLAQVALITANQDFQALKLRFTREAEVFRAMVNSHKDQISAVEGFGAAIVATQTASAVLESVSSALNLAGDLAEGYAEALGKSFPLAAGLANDVTSLARGALSGFGVGTAGSLKVNALIAEAAARQLNATVVGGLEFAQEGTLMSLGFKQDELQAAYEFEQTYRELLSQHGQFVELMAAYQSALAQVNNLVVDGETIRSRLQTLRQRAAAVINGYRTKDLTFRTFRNEALEQYRTLFDLASRYTYMAAKSYDYETGLLGSPAGQSVFARIVASRSLGDLTNGVPRSTASTLGDAGLAGSLAQLNADFSVAEGRLGLNNPDHYNTVFSLRQELYRILYNGDSSSADAWKQTLEQHIVPDVMADPNVAAYCRNIKKPDGTPVPGFIIPFSTTIQHGKNFFGLDYAAGDHNYSPSSFATKIAAVGIAFPGYVGMENGVTPDPTQQYALGATPYVYLIPCGTDYMLAPLGDTNTLRSWDVNDQALPLPYNLGASAFNTSQFFTANGTLSEQPWVIRKHQAFRAVSDPTLFYSDLPIIYSNARLIGRSVWNSQWKLVIPAYTLLNNEQMALNNFINSVQDIQLFIRSYSHAGN